MDVQQPIILIGTGRSGSTLLTRMLDAHPAIDFKGETDFLLPSLWLDVWYDRFWLNWPRQMSANARSAHTAFPEWDSDQLEAERQRAGLLVVELFTRLLRIDGSRYQVWGYKELWNGSPSFRFDWALYDSVVPRAVWLHLVRDPFAFASSCARWNEESLTTRFLMDRLKEWVSILDYNAERQSTGRYQRVRYEDLVGRPQEELSRLLRVAGLAWHEECAVPASQQTFHAMEQTRGGRALCGNELAELVDGIEGLGERMAALGYHAPSSVTIEETAQADAKRDAPDLRNPENFAAPREKPRSAKELERRKQLNDGYRMARTIDSRPWLHGSTKQLSSRLTKLLLSMLRGGNPS
jgi:hypothetical protein